MDQDRCSHSGPRHGRFAITSPPCDGCGCRWRLSGCVKDGARPLVEVLRGDPFYRLSCSCGREIRFVVPPFVDRLSVSVAPVLPPTDMPSLPARTAA